MRKGRGLNYTDITCPNCGAELSIHPSDAGRRSLEEKCPECGGKVFPEKKENLFKAAILFAITLIGGGLFLLGIYYVLYLLIK
jgi:hypothetical protein